MSQSVTWRTALRISWCPSICSEVKFPSRHVFRMILQWVCEVFNLWRADCKTLTLCQLVSFLRRTFLPRCLQSRGIFLFTFSDCWNSRFRIFIRTAFLLTESCCCIFFQICSKSPGVFPYSESDGYRGSLKTSALPASSSISLLLWLLCNANACFMLIHAKQISDWNKFTEVIPVQT